jgi:hypothetical protein
VLFAFEFLHVNTSDIISGYAGNGKMGRLIEHMEGIISWSVGSGSWWYVLAGAMR